MALTDDQLDRYARHIILHDVGGAGQAKLMDARVLVVGAGGLGAPLLMYLAAAGVGGGERGALGIVDFDTVDLSNLQRQIIHTTSSIGTRKVDSAAKVISDLNPDINVQIHDTELTAENACALLTDYDLVADGTDSFETRFLVNEAAIATKIPLLSAAVGQFDGQVATFKGHEPDLPCYRCFVNEAPPRGAVPSCSEAGVLGALTGVVGSLQALEVMKEILGIGESLAGRLMIYDGLSAETRTVRLPKDRECSACK
jgi:molybdopterin-synthase adenylyltransferase